jgi:hypothetical protein
MENGLVSPSEEGTPQGGPLSPVLSNIVLNELDQELERRGHQFTRYADDCNIYVRSRRAGERVMRSVTRLLTTKLKLRVNSEKSVRWLDHGNGNSWDSASRITSHRRGVSRRKRGHGSRSEFGNSQAGHGG